MTRPRDLPPLSVLLGLLAGMLVLTSLAAWGVRTLLRGRTPVAWWLTCGILLGVSLLGPLGGTSPAAVGTLLALHLVVGGTVAAGLDPRRAHVRHAVPAR